MSIELELVNTKQEISTRAFTWFSHQSGKQSDFYSGYIYLSEKTFINRYNHYIDDLKNKGYLTYTGIKFLPDGQIISHKYDTNIFMNRLFKKPFNIILEPKEKPNGLLDKLKCSFSRTLIGRNAIPTVCDQDVFYALMKQVYGISWE